MLAGAEPVAHRARPATPTLAAEMMPAMGDRSREQRRATGSTTNCCSVEWMPSAPITTSAVARAPLANVSVACPSSCSKPMHLWPVWTTPAGSRSTNMAEQVGAVHAVELDLCSPAPAATSPRRRCRPGGGTADRPTCAPERRSSSPRPSRSSMRTPLGWIATPAPTSVSVGRLLVEAHVDAALKQGGGGGDAADAAADDRNAQVRRLRHCLLRCLEVCLIDDVAPQRPLRSHEGFGTPARELPMGSAPCAWNFLRTSSVLSTATTSLLIFSTISSGVSGGATSPNQATEVKPGSAASDMVGTSGRCGERSRRAHGEDLERARLVLRQRRGQVVEHEEDMAADEVVHGRCRAAIGHMVELHAGHRLEQRRGEVRRGADTLRAVGDGAGLGLGLLDQLLHRRHARAWG